jgi:hypothetical protein
MTRAFAFLLEKPNPVFFKEFYIDEKKREK